MESKKESLKVLVTGATGFLGQWLVRTLLEQQHQVYVLARNPEKAKKLFLNNNLSKNLDSKKSSISNSTLASTAELVLQILPGDVTDLSSMQKAFQGMDTVFHLAGVIAYKKKDREQMEQVNVQGTQNVVQACLENKVRRLVYLSSVVAIGAGFSSEQVLNESSTYNIQHLNLGYFETKRKAEDIVKEAVKNKSLDAVILNPSTIYGAGDAEKGSRSMQIKVAKGKFPFYTSGGVNVVAVEDVIQGIISAWHIGRKGERYILSGENMTIQKLFATIAEAAGVPAPNKKLPNWLLHLLGGIGDGMDALGLKGPLSRENAWTSTMFHWFDNSKAKAELGFSPRPSKEAIVNSVQWMKDKHII